MAKPDFTTPTGILAVYPHHLPSPTKLEPMNGGNANFVWRAHLSIPLPRGANTLVIKHAEPFLATNKDFNCDDIRIHDEHYALSLFAQGGPFAFLMSSSSNNCQIIVPTVYHYDAASKILYMSDFGSYPTVKQFLIDSAYVSQRRNHHRMHTLGVELGGFLRSLHAAGRNHLEQLQQGLNGVLDSKPKQQLIKRAYYDQYRDIMVTMLGIDDAAEAVEAVEAFARSETFNAQDTFVMGDFWPGNVLVDPVTLGTACIVDWEMARIGVPTLDASQFCAELYMADRIKGERAAKEMLKGFAQGYGIENLDLRAFAVGLATHVTVVGALYGWEPDKEKLKKVAREAAVYAEKAGDPDVVRTIFQ